MGTASMWQTVIDTVVKPHFEARYGPEVWIQILCDDEEDINYAHIFRQKVRKDILAVDHCLLMLEEETLAVIYNPPLPVRQKDLSRPWGTVIGSVRLSSPNSMETLEALLRRVELHTLEECAGEGAAAAP
jgi:hypothetical protein